MYFDFKNLNYFCVKLQSHLIESCMESLSHSFWSLQVFPYFISLLNPFLLGMLNFYHLYAPSYLVMLYMLLHLSGWQGKFQGKWLSIFWSVRYAPADNFSLPHFNKLNLSKTKFKKQKIILRPVFALFVTFFSGKGSLVVKNNFDRAFL